MQKESIDYAMLVAKYLDNEISQKEETALDNWIQESEKNKKFFIETAKTWEKSVIALQNPEVTQKRFNLFSQRLKTKKRRIMYQWAISSSAAIILLFIGLKLFQPTFLFGDKMVTVITASEKKEIVLPDKSVVWLNAQSSLKYPKNFNCSRDVFLTGEAYFNVKKDKQRVFSVHTENITIEVLGTTFVVTDRKETSHSETILESGKINLTVNISGKKMEIKPNQQVIYNKTDNSIQTLIVNASDYTSWRKKNLSFENKPFKDVCIQLSKWYNLEIDCRNKTLSTIPISFTVDDESVEEILNILQQITSFTWKKEAHNKIIIV